MYVDAINLYGCPLSQAFPETNYKWLFDNECRAAEAALQVKLMRDLNFEENQAFK